jgi:hypothetical protein
VRESIEAANREAQDAQVHQHRPASGIGGQRHSRASSTTNLHASPPVSARGAPSISMGQDSYVASQREQILAAQHQQQRQGQDGGADSESARLHAHDHSAPAEPPQRSLSRNSRPLPGAGGGGVGMSYDHSSQHALHAGSGMAGSSLAGAGVSHVTATVAVDADGNALHDAHNDDLELQQRLAATGGSYEQSNEQFDVHEADDQGQHQHHEQEQQQEGDEDYGDDEDFSPAAGVDAAASSSGREDDHHQDDVDAEAEAEAGFDGDGTGGGFVVDNGDAPDEQMYDQDGNPLLGPQGEHYTARSSELDAPPEPEHSASPHMGRMRASQQQGHVADSMAGFDVHHAEDDQQAQSQSQQSQRQHLAPTSSASSTKRSQRSTRMAANNAQLSELMAQQDAYEPQPPSSWRATKGGGGGLIKVDPNSRTATTIGGTVVPLDSSSGGGALASGRRQ